MQGVSSGWNSERLTEWEEEERRQSRTSAQLAKRNSEMHRTPPSLRFPAAEHGTNRQRPRLLLGRSVYRVHPTLPVQFLALQLRAELLLFGVHDLLRWIAAA
jgi:hypothetical protein